jgi:ribosomal protein S18 acetylase RimI-like enzyme
MKARNRPFDEKGADFEQMERFLIRDYAVRQSNFVWMFSRLADWKCGLWSEEKCFGTFQRRNGQLWFDPLGSLVGFVVAENGDGNFSVFTGPGYDFLAAEMVDWVLAHWSDRAGLCAEVHESQASLRSALKSRGFTERGPIATTRQYDLSIKATEPVVLPSGFTLVDMDNNRDYRGKKMLTCNAFGHGAEVQNVDVLAYEYSRASSPAYDGYYDLSVLDAAGNHVAGCEGFADYENSVAEVERICTHNDYRRLGLAEAVVRACFHRLYGNGIRTAYIEGYSNEAQNLYEKLGPCTSRQWFMYERL